MLAQRRGQLENFMGELLRADGITAIWALMMSSGIVGYDLGRRLSWYFGVLCGMAFYFAGNIFMHTLHNYILYKFYPDRVPGTVKKLPQEDSIRDIWGG